MSATFEFYICGVVKKAAGAVIDDVRVYTSDALPSSRTSIQRRIARNKFRPK